MAWIKFVPFYLFVINFYIRESYSATSQSDFQCKDENNNAVDWYVIYKLPKIAESSRPLVNTGVAYLYITSATVNSGWTLSERSINDVTSIPGRTLSPLYDDNVASRSMWILYNDQPPDGSTNSRYGHTKGVVMADGLKGLWMIHSVPAFPPTPRTGVKGGSRSSSETGSSSSSAGAGSYSYPDSGTRNGQSFMCISVQSTEIATIARQLMYNQIISYRKNVPSYLEFFFPTFLNASNHVRINDAPWNNKATIRTVGGVEFISFAKSDKWQKDLYHGFVAPQLNSHLIVQSWRYGPGKLHTDCKSHHVYNVESVQFTMAEVHFPSTRDHSKWAISATQGPHRNWVCVGDINRIDTQFSRGGGALCINSQALWTNYRYILMAIETCPHSD